MSLISDIQEVLSVKDKALVLAIRELSRHMDERCEQGHCDLEADPPYHWRACPTNMMPIIKELKEAWERR